MSIGKRIKKLRLSKKLTQKQLGEKIGRSTESIKKYESGEITPPWTVLEDIAKALDVPFNELIPDYSQEAIDAFYGSPRTYKITVTHEVLAERKIKDKNGVEFTTALSLDEALRQIYDIGYLLQHQEKAYYNGHLLSDEERRRALDMLKLLFPEYQDDEE
ncbi:helix-turn-helix domain-containing protein [Desulfolucanica intricata]|uniref:helix-turn-helix domain-containing protein n=1 Tax=Desulfolucanica intricata TaxID=1285191 RepID=UPI001EE48C00|nr:helix-turn-helix domain-containing protein [Desulfolucanica intricata]